MSLGKKLNPRSGGKKTLIIISPEAERLSCSTCAIGCYPVNFTDPVKQLTKQTSSAAYSEQIQISLCSRLYSEPGWADLSKISIPTPSASQKPHKRLKNGLWKTDTVFFFSQPLCNSTHYPPPPHTHTYPQPSSLQNAVSVKIEMFQCITEMSTLAFK